MALAEPIAKAPSRSGGAAQNRTAMSRLAGAANAADAAVIAFVADVIEDASWEGQGIASVAQWLRWKFGMSRGRARKSVTIAKRWHELPYLAQVFSEGRLSFDQVAIVARRCPTEYERTVVSFAFNATLTQLAYSLVKYHFDSDPEPEREERNRASLRFNDSGRARLSADVDAETGKRLQSAIDQGVARRKAALPDDADGDVGGLPPTPAPTLLDGLIDCLDASVSADPSESRRHAHHPIAHIELSQLASLDDELVLAGRWHLGPMMPSEWAALAALCDADIRVLVTDHGQPLALGRSTRTVPAWLRTIIVDRDGGCQCCGSASWLEVHHIVHWIDGGPTDPSNLITLCRSCHQRHHRGEIVVSGDPTRPGDPDAIRITNQHGVSLRRTPTPTPPDQLPIGRYRPPLGEKMQWDWLTFERNEHALPSSPPRSATDPPDSPAPPGDPRLN